MRIFQVSQVTGDVDLKQPADGSIQEGMLAHLRWMREYAKGLKNTCPSQKGRKVGPPRRNENQVR